MKDHNEALGRHYGMMSALVAGLDIGDTRALAQQLQFISDTLLADIRLNKDLHFTTAHIGEDGVTYDDFRQAAYHLNRILSLVE